MFKPLRVAIKRKLGWLGVPTIVPYTAFGDSEKVLITGAVVEDKGIARPEPGQSMWKNILTMVKRYAGDEIAGARVKIEYGGMQELVRTNEMGLFHTILPNYARSPDQKSWQPVRFTLMDRMVDDQETIRAETEVHIAGEDADFLVVSDIDDTVMVSHSTKKLKKLRVMLLGNALTRLPFEGVAAFYRALQRSPDGKERSIFYVSASEWNLYDLLTDFFEVKQIPRGAMLLSDAKLRIFSIFKSGDKVREKVNRIMDLFELYYRHHFILIGDSGQKDPEIYLQITSMYPSRVKSIYIRYIGSSKRNRRLERLMREARDLGTEMILVRSTTEAARHAVERGFIRKDEVAEIYSERAREMKVESP
jgi:phosphatidate phosphatase APP1